MQTLLPMSMPVLFTPVAAALALLVMSVTPPSTAAADHGHLGVTLGAGSLTLNDQTSWQPELRMEAALRLIGPLELGAYFQARSSELPADDVQFGGGPMLQLRPEGSFGGFIPHALVEGGRVNLPSDNGGIEAWVLSVGAGAGFALAAGFAIETQVRHSWYFDLPVGLAVADTGWTVTGGISWAIP